MLYPDKYFNKVEQITIDFLNENKIKALILDVDNTLIDYNKKLSEKIVSWAIDLKAKGIRLYILSNSGHKDKVETVANKLDIPYENLAKKPMKSGFLRVQKKLNEKPENIGVVGDQIFTDVIGGNLCNMFTILVDPVDKKDYWYTAWKRPLENMVKKRYKMKIENK